MADIIAMVGRGKKPAPRLYEMLWAVMAQQSLTATAKCVFSVLVLKHFNRETGQCNPSVTSIAVSIGTSRRTVFTAIAELSAAGWIGLRGTKGGSSANTNQYLFPRLDLTERGEGGFTPTGEACFTGRGEENDTRGEADCTAGVKQASHELSTEPSKNYSAGARASAGTGANRADGKRASDGSGSRSLVTPGTPAFEAWRTHFEEIKAEKMLKHMRDCVVSGEAVIVRTPLPPSRADADGARS